MNKYILNIIVSTLLALAILLSLVNCSLPQSSGILNLTDNGPITLDPAVSSEAASHSFIMQIFSGLVRLDDSLKPAPDIAERWQRSPDGKSYLFYLRKGAKFHDGTEVKAQDFKFSWERACRPETGSQTAAVYLNDIVGSQDVLEGKTTNIRGIEVIDDYTLKVNIDAPKAYFLSKLSYPTTFVVNKTTISHGSKWWLEPNGTGPFKLSKWQEGKTLILEPNQFYYLQKPKVDKIIFHLLAGTPIDLYEMNNIDVAEVYIDYIERATDKKGPFYSQLVVFPELSLNYIGFNVKKPPFDDVNVRKAFCYAVDRKRIIDITMKGAMTKAKGILPPGMPGYNENIIGFEYDAKKAQELIKLSKYRDSKNLPPITITISGWGGDISTSLGAIIQNWRDNLGIAITVRQIEPEVFLYYLRGEADEMFMLGWVADYPDPQNFLDTLFHSDAAYNTGNYSNAMIDDLLDKAAIEPDDNKRIALYRQTEEKLLDDGACFPLWYNTSYYLIKPYVKNYIRNPIGIPELKQVSIEK